MLCQQRLAQRATLVRRGTLVRKACLVRRSILRLKTAKTQSLLLLARAGMWARKATLGLRA